MKILITGISGMLGVDLYRVLSNIPPKRPKVLQGKYEIMGLDIKDFPSVPFTSPFVHKADITDFEAIKELFSQLIPDFVIHTAAYTDVDGCEKDPEKAHKINAVGTQNVALLCWKLDIPLMYISTDFVFKGDRKIPYIEFDEPCPVNVYGKSKLRGEEYVRAFSSRFFIVRTSWLYGQYGRNFVETILKLAEGKSELKVVDDQVGSPTYTLDLAEEIKKLLLAYEKLASSNRRKITDGRLRSRGFSPLDEGSKAFTSINESEGSIPIEQKRVSPEHKLSKLYGIYHITNSGSCSWYEFAQKILGLAGIRRVKVIPITSEELARPAARPKFSVLDNYRLKMRLGDSMRKWKEALGDYLKEHFREVDVERGEGEK